MEKAFLVLRRFDYEGDDVDSVWSSESAAVARAKYVADEWSYSSTTKIVVVSLVLDVGSYSSDESPQTVVYEHEGVER